MHSVGINWGCAPLPRPRELLKALPLSAEAARTVTLGREAIRRSADGLDERLLVIVGPCSVHDGKLLIDYAERLTALRQQMGDRLLLVLRAHFEKPRTSTGWKGFLYDPHLDGSNDMAHALVAMRQLLLTINEMGLPVGTEFLEPTTPAYISDLISWATVGARTASSQIHRQMASGLPMPVGFKNTPEGDIETAIQALLTARVRHTFPTLDPDGRPALATTQGNSSGYVVLRGGKGRPNTDAIGLTATRLQSEGLPGRLIIDCSHDNCGRQPQRQLQLFRHLLDQKLSGDSAIAGLMVESNLKAGSQHPNSPLTYGVSITDPCIDWDSTQSLLEWAYDALGASLPVCT